MTQVAGVKGWVDAWMRRREGSALAPITLTQRRIYILPTGQGLLFALILFALLIASVNYNLSLGYLLTFLLGSMALVSLLHTFRNLAHITLAPGKVSPVFAGDRAEFRVVLSNPTGLARHAIGLKQGKSGDNYGDVPERETAVVPIYVSAEKRGWQALGRFTVFSRFPLGLFYAWSNPKFELRCLVYPRPETGPVPPAYAQSLHERGKAVALGDEDFSGLKPYRAGDSPRNIDWKALAREQGLMTKLFSGHAAAEVWLDWEAGGQLDTEARLSRLARWALDAHASGVRYGLRLPNSVVLPDVGEPHLRQVLRALALFQIHE